MQMNSIPASTDDPYAQSTGIIHLAFSVGSEKNVDSLTRQLKADGFEVLNDPVERATAITSVRSLIQRETVSKSRCRGSLYSLLAG